MPRRSISTARSRRRSSTSATDLGGTGAIDGQAGLHGGDGAQGASRVAGRDRQQHGERLDDRLPRRPRRVRPAVAHGLPARNAHAGLGRRARCGSHHRHDPADRAAARRRDHRRQLACGAVARRHRSLYAARRSGGRAVGRAPDGGRVPGDGVGRPNHRPARAEHVDLCRTGRCRSSRWGAMPRNRR